MPSPDRRLIAPILLSHFPTMEKATSDEWHGFLNAMTGLSIDIDEPNSNAFDKWRQALETQGKADVWGISTERAQRIQERGEELKRLEEARLAALSVTLAALAEEAPTKTAEQLIADAEAAVK
jgi:hypothetical protein